MADYDWQWCLDYPHSAARVIAELRAENGRLRKQVGGGYKVADITAEILPREAMNDWSPTHEVTEVSEDGAVTGVSLVNAPERAK